MVKVQLSNGVSFGTKIYVEDNMLESGKLVVDFVGNSGNDVPYEMALIPFATEVDGTPKALTSVITEGSTITIEGVANTDIVTIIGNRAM